MNVLWITSFVPPLISRELGFPVSNMGGWINSSLAELLKEDDLELTIACPYNGTKLVKGELNKVNYFLLPLHGTSLTRYNKGLEKYWSIIKHAQHPDVVHIHGTEFPFGLSWMRACGSENCVISIQGLTSVIERYYYVNDRIPSTLRDIIKRDSIKKTRKSFQKRGELERQMIKESRYLIGRTEWDKVHSLSINRKVKYYHCGETLRPSFYVHKWDYEKCEKHSIFISNGSSPIKGAHIMIKALPLILSNYPKAKLYISDRDPFTIPWYRLTGYMRYLKKLIVNNNLESSVIFTGNLDEKSMCERFLKSNVFVCCSSIENSPNSLGEAQLLQMPYISSFVGGVPSIVNNNFKYLYRFEEYEILSSKICEIFSNNGNTEVFKADLSQYSPIKNRIKLKEIYNNIVKDNY